MSANFYQKAMPNGYEISANFRENNRRSQAFKQKRKGYFERITSFKTGIYRLRIDWVSAST